MRVAMMGTGTFAAPTFEALLAAEGVTVVGLVTQPDRLTGVQRGSTRLVGRTLKQIALDHGLPVAQPERINTPESVATLTTWAPELLVVAAYGQILSAQVLQTATRGGINVHASLLPKYRGAAPIAWAIYHGETVSGVTIIRMTTGLDAGDMLLQEALPIDPEETAGELEVRLARLGARLALEVIARMKIGPVTGVKQEKSLVTRAPKLTKEQGLIDWTRPATGVVNQIRAMQPWPTPYTFLHRPDHPTVRVLVTRAAALPPVELALPPGMVIPDSTSSPRLFVAAGEGTRVEVRELQPAGKRRMTALEFLRGHPLTGFGVRFGGES